jgi:hypothetical protein
MLYSHQAGLGTWKITMKKHAVPKLETYTFPNDCEARTHHSQTGFFGQTLKNTSHIQG